MSEKTLALLAAFDQLPPREKFDLADAILRRLPPIDSGPLDDDLVAAAGDVIAEELDKEERETNAPFAVLAD